MSTQVQLRGGTTTSHATFTGASREATVDTDKHVLVIHDGSTAGGFPMARESRQIIAGTGLTGGGTLGADRTFAVSYGTTSGTACQGNDSRLSDSRAPTGTAGGDLGGTYPNPTVLKVNGVTVSSFALTILDDSSAAVSRTTLGLGSLATQDSTAVSITGGTVKGLSSPGVSDEAATKSYVDSLVTGLKWKQSVKAATTGNGTLATAYANGQTIDGVTLATSDRILVKDQTTGSENGIYIVPASGPPTRSTDADSAAELIDAVVVVEQGTVNADKAFTCTNDAITVGTTSLTFVNFASMITGALLATNNLSDLGSASTARTNLGLGTLATQNGTFSGTSSGTNTGDQTITLTGDVTGTGTGSFATTLTTAQPAVHTWALAQTFTVAPVFTDAPGTRTALGLGTLATQSGTFSGTSSGTNTGDQTITLTGDVTGSGTGSFVTTLATAQPAVHTWALAQTFTVAPVFTDASGTRTALGLGSLATQSGTFSGTSSGTNTGDQTITLTGDVTGSGTGSFATTLATAQPAAHTWALAQTFTTAPVFTDASGSRTALGLGTIATQGAGAVAITGGTITGMPTPSASSDVATKAYVDTLITGLKWKQSVKAATTTNGTLATAFANGQTIDGVTLSTGDRFLAKDQTTGTENGIYIVAASGAPTRAADADSGAELVDAVVIVEQGTVNADKAFTCTNDAITLGSTAVVFVNFASTITGALLATNNLSDVGNAGTARTNLGLGTLATQNGTFSGTSSGTNTGDQTITLTGDITGTGTGSFAATLTTAQPAVHTWALAQTFTVAPIFTDAPGTRTALGLGTLSTQSGTFSGTSSGTNTGDQTITLTGDVTGSGTGSFVTTLATAQPAVHTWALAQTFTVAPVFSDAPGTRTALGLGTLATQSGTFSGTSSGTNTGDQTISLTGDITGSGTGSFAATLANTAVTPTTYGDSTHIPQITVDSKGRITAATNVLAAGGGGGVDLATVIAMAVALG